MNYFSLPVTTDVKRVVPKNAFDPYTNTKEKKLFTDLIRRMTWSNKLSKETVNLQGSEIQEIQIFIIELKKDGKVESVLNIIDRSIPYPIIFIVVFQEQIQISTSQKHLHPTKQDIAVIDWRFNTDWFKSSERRYELNLKKKLDEVFRDLCIQISGQPSSSKESIQSLIQYEQRLNELKKNISRLELEVAKAKQFNKKVELNQELNKVIMQLKALRESR